MSQIILFVSATFRQPKIYEGKTAINRSSSQWKRRLKERHNSALNELSTARPPMGSSHNLTNGQVLKVLVDIKNCLVTDSS